MEIKKTMMHIIKNVEYTLEEINEAQVEEFMNAILNAERVFVYGAGRSGLVAKAFAMRLMHLGITVYVIGEIVTPSMKKDDLLITISGSGETTSVVNAASIAKKIGAKVACITSYENSSLAKLSDIIVIVKGRTKLDGERDFFIRQMEGEHYPIAPLGTLFEIAAMILLDSIVPKLMEELKVSEEIMRARHATIE